MAAKLVIVNDRIFCAKCSTWKSLVNDFYPIGKNKYKTPCAKCKNIKSKETYSKNIDSRKKYSKNYYKNNRSNILRLARQGIRKNKIDYGAKYRIQNVNKIREYDKKRNKKISRINSLKFYRNKNRNLINKKYSDYVRRRSEIDVNFKIRRLLSKLVGNQLKLRNIPKSGESIRNILPFSIEEFRQWIEDKFEPWMTWKNHGRYDPNAWDDDNASTWTWQIDHIVPQSDFDFKLFSKSDKEIQKCWSLINIRPLSSKQNLLDGVNRTRHRKKKK